MNLKSIRDGSEINIPFGIEGTFENIEKIYNQFQDMFFQTVGEQPERNNLILDFRKLLIKYQQVIVHSNYSKFYDLKEARIDFENIYPYTSQALCFLAYNYTENDGIIKRVNSTVFPDSKAFGYFLDLIDSLLSMNQGIQRHDAPSNSTTDELNLNDLWITNTSFRYLQ